ncbi:hypothetical protein QFC20_001636 [Naganishia adeliensis]|uniref:Uncharacterized protein n=1 Tax=Naganishia adeliensis TaxID=92952 RepID=A0ACC2WSG3_9TREE|nr:hypothetical protein QFC20_001636 [Naganishia adeliensis]
MDDAYDEAPEFAAPVEDENNEDDFVPSGSKKAKAKAKATKAKKATAAKEKAVKGKKATQAKGKKGKVVEPVQPSFTEESLVEASKAPAVSGVNENPTTDNATAPAPTVPEVVETPPGASAKGNPKRIVVVGKKAPKSAEIIEDEGPTMPKASADVVPDTVPIAAPVPDEPEAVKEDAVVAMTGRGTQGKKAAARKKVVESDVESEKEVEKETTPPVAAQPSVPAAKVLQPKASLAVNPPAGVKLEPSFVVDKNGNVKEFRTCRTDLPKVVQTTGGVKRIGFSRRSAIPSLHKNFKAPPKRLPPPPKKPSRKKEDSDDDSDEFDENGKKKIRPGDPEWYMMDVD